jgi:hypothetical protein
MPKFNVGDVIEVIGEPRMMTTRTWAMTTRTWVIEGFESSRYIIRYRSGGRNSPTTGRSLIRELDRICKKVGSINKDEITVSSATYLDSDDITSEDKDVISKALEYYPHES